MQQVVNVDEEQPVNVSEPSTRFHCQMCSFEGESKKDLKKHVKLNHKPEEQQQQQVSSNDSLYECLKCELLFRNYEMYCAHKVLHQMQDQTEAAAAATMASFSSDCSDCGLQFTNSLQYFAHMQTVHGAQSQQLLTNVVSP